MNKLQLIKELSNKTDFTQKDVRTFLNALIEIFGEKISRREGLSVYGFGKLQYSKIKPRKAFKPNKDGSGEYIDVPEGEKVLFTLATSLRRGEVVLDEVFDENE